MSRYILDTDILTLYQRSHPAVLQHAAGQSPTDVAITAITIQEQLDGWHSVLAKARTHPQIAADYDFLANFIAPSLVRFPLLSFPESAILRYEQLLTLRLNVGRMDLRIAAIALEHGAIVVTRNKRDFGRVPGLVTEDWSV
jgi:tRNA(fMet)-specific endonuclease VapC